MNKKLFLFVATTLTAISSIASAQSLTLRAEGGAAIPLTSPQKDIFDPGLALALKPELGIGSYFSVGPQVQFLTLATKPNDNIAGTSWLYGGFGRVKRPHDNKNKDDGFKAASPWVDLGAGYVRTGDLDRFGWNASVGVSAPMDDARCVWAGPFVRYDTILQRDGQSGFNNNDARTLIVGMSFEFGASPIKSEPVVQQEEKKTLPKVEPKRMPEPTPPPPQTETRIIEINQIIQFDWNSSVIHSSNNQMLNDVLEVMLTDKDFKLTVEGHTSSEGQVEYNDKLSLARANAVVDWLAKNGVARDKMTAKGFGSRVPIADNATEAGRKLNRRVDFVAIKLEKKQ